MIDQRFYQKSGALSLTDLAKIGGAEIDLSALPSKVTPEMFFEDLAPLDEAEPVHFTFFHNAKYLDQLKESKAGACYIAPEMAKHLPKKTVALQTPNPQRAFALAAQGLYPDSNGSFERGGESIHPSSKIGKNVLIEPGVVIQSHAMIGNNVRLGANAVIGRGVVIGDDCDIGANVTISHAIIGRRVILYPGARIGQAGFGFATDDQGFVTVPQLGRVIIEDNVEIGANTTIDRGSLKDTRIGRSTRIDNLVMIGHNVELGEGCILVGQVGIAGSTKLGNHVICAGQAGLVGHLTIGNHVRIGAQSGVMRDISDHETVCGSPAQPMNQWLRQIVSLQKMVEEHHLKRKKGAK